MVGTFAGLNALLLGFGAFLAFKTRNVSSAFNESKFIAVCMYNMIVLGCLILPVIYISQAGFFTIFDLRSIGTIACATFILFALFGSKLYIIFFRRGENTSEYLKTFRNKGLGGVHITRVAERPPHWDRHAIPQQETHSPLGRQLYSFFLDFS